LDGNFTGTITMASSGSGNFTPSYLTWSGTSASKTFTYIPTSLSGSPHTISVTNSGTLTNSGTVAYTVNNVIGIGDSNLFVSPYNWYTNGTTSLMTTTPGAYHKLGFTGTTIKVNLASPAFTGSSMVLVSSIDNGPKIVSTVAASTMQVVLSNTLAAGTHQLQLWFSANDPTQDLWTTPTMACVVTGYTLTTSGTSATPSPIRSKRMVWFGDSVSYGIFALRLSSHPDGNDATASPGFAVAEALNAEVGIIGFGSQGYGKTGLGNVPRIYDPSSPTASGWRNYHTGQSRLVAGALSPTPDYIVCYHGTADYTGSASDANVTAGVEGMLPAVRSAASGAKIFCVVPANRQKLSAITTGFENAFGGKTTVGTIGPSTVYKGVTDANVFLVDLGSEFSSGLSTSGGGETLQSIDDIHPDIPTNGRIAAAIVAAIQYATGGSGGGSIFGGSVISP
jgi:hypothetical protein